MRKEEEIIIDPLICFNACRQKGRTPSKYGTDLNLKPNLKSDKMALIHSSVCEENSPSRCPKEVHKFSEAKSMREFCFFFFSLSSLAYPAFPSKKQKKTSQQFTCYSWLHLFIGQLVAKTSFAWLII